MSSVLCIICKQYVLVEMSQPTFHNGQRLCDRCARGIERNAKPISREAFSLFNKCWDKADLQQSGNNAQNSD